MPSFIFPFKAYLLYMIMHILTIMSMEDVIYTIFITVYYGNIKRKIMNLEQRMDGWMELMRTRNGCEEAGEDGSLLVFMFSLAALTSL